LTIILISLFLIIGYFFIFPFYKNLKNNITWQIPVIHSCFSKKEA
jgi:hypothetical protein